MFRTLAVEHALAILKRMDGPGESSSERLLAVPGMQRVPSDKAELFRLRDFVGDALCARLIELIEAERRPSTIANENGDALFRTSDTCDLDPSVAPVIELEAMLTKLSGIAPTHGEPLQGQRYEIGQEFKAHSDYFTPGSEDFDRFCSIAGQRTWTFMVYLNTAGAGGATRFKEVGKTFQPEAGTLLCWNNRRPDGSVNPNTLHHGMKVRKGRKYVITKWYREGVWE